MGLGQRRPPRTTVPRARRTNTPDVDHSSLPDDIVTVERLTHDGRGVAQARSGKRIFIEQALPGEQVSVRVHRQRGRYDEAHVAEYHTQAPERVAARCAHFGVCGGCTLQHMDADAQLTHKRQTLAEHFTRESITLPDVGQIAGPAYGYRRRARLGVNVDREGRRLLGFRRRNSERLLDIEMCPVLTPALASLLTPLKNVIDELASPRQVGHIELLESDDARCVVVRQLKPVPQDQALWQAFAEQTGTLFAFDNGAGVPETLPNLHYSLKVEQQTLSLAFRPGDFFQVNREINQSLVSTVMDWLAPDANMRILDLFAGVGNFTLALATSGAQVHALEGRDTMVQRLMRNAEQNGLSNISAEVADLTSVDVTGQVDAVVLDPPRDGARRVCESLANRQVARIAYVACDPATLARDVAILCGRGYRVTRAAVVDMFPQTAHLESVVLLEKVRGNGR